MVDIPNAPSKRRSPTTWQIIEKVVIPLALVLLGASQVLVAHQQVQVAKLQADRQAEDANSNLQLKYVELFYRDITDPDPAKKQTGIALLAAMQPSVAQTVSRIIFADPKSTPALRAQTSATLATAQRFGSAVNYKLVIYYPSRATAEARQLSANLTNLGFPNRVDLREVPLTFLDAANLGYHIRYEQNFEGQAAEDLLRVLSEASPTKRFRKVRVIGKTSSDGSLTIFLFGAAA